MAVALSQDKYHFSPPQLEILSMQIRRGDLTPVLKVYEEDLKSPLKSMVAGSLIRSLLIQVQKMKVLYMHIYRRTPTDSCIQVDVDVALSGIDKLLKSQELTFAFVGVAPALAIVYVIFGWVKNVWQSGQGRGKYGGRGRRQSIWLAMRYVDLATSDSLLFIVDISSLEVVSNDYLFCHQARRRQIQNRYLPWIKD
jgi:nuclear control of ATPase protein 2